MTPCPKFGNHLKLEIHGASHAPCLRFTLENFPSDFEIDEAALAAFMERRAPGRDRLSTQRKEADQVEIVSREPFSGIIRNTDMRPKDYGSERTVPRPGHADFGQWIESGRIPTGGGANSGRLTAALCAVGGVCLQFLAKRGITVAARIEKIHGNADDPNGEIENAIKSLDSVGGTIVCEATGFPAGLGGALFGGIETELSGAVFAIPGVKGIEFGDGFACADMLGSEFNDAFTVAEGGEVRTTTNRQGGIMGGRSNGMPITFRVALRPTPTIFKSQPSVDLATMTQAELSMKGRHDPCIVRRAVPVVEAVTAFVLADTILAAEAASPRICLTLTGKTLEEDIAQYQSQRYFTDMVELRIDLLEEGNREQALGNRQQAIGNRQKAIGETNAYSLMPNAYCLLPIAYSIMPNALIYTFRRKCDGGAFEGDESVREEFFRKLLKQLAENPRQNCCDIYVDFEEDFRRPELDELARRAKVKVIRSLHDFSGPIPDVVAKCRELRGTSNDIPKIAFMPKSAADVTRLFEQTKDFDEFPHILCAMGPLGLPSRVLAVRTHSLLTYASVGGLSKIGHITPHELVRTYRIRTITPNARVEFVAPEEVELANARFSAADEDAVALPKI